MTPPLTWRIVFYTHFQPAPCEVRWCETDRLATLSDSRVEKWRGGLGGPIRPAPSCAGASRALPCSVSTSRSSNRTCGSPAPVASPCKTLYTRDFGSVVTSTDRSDSFRRERACLPGGSHTR